jgi:hypothetical protein
LLFLPIIFVMVAWASFAWYAQKLYLNDLFGVNLISNASYVSGFPLWLYYAAGFIHLVCVCNFLCHILNLGLRGNDGP